MVRWEGCAMPQRDPTWPKKIAWMTVWVVFRGRGRRRLCVEGCGLAALGLGFTEYGKVGRVCNATT